ncbi:MAG: hypothetical protein NVSMB23_09800 [Myxococcales bacterium]
MTALLAALFALGAPGGISLSAEPARLLPAPDARAHLSIDVGAAAEAPVLSASVGTIENLRPAGPGRFTADYVPPDQTIPQVALIGAVAGGQAGFLALPLYGLGDAVVKTRPRGRTSVRIGDQRFGPILADARGRAEVPVVVPPGVREAFHGDDPIDLHVPPSLTLHAVISKATAGADFPAEVQVRVFAVEPGGNPREDARVILRASRGTTSAAVALGGGIYAATWSVPPGPAGDESLSAALEDAPLFEARAVLARPAGAAATVALQADRGSLTAGEIVELTVHAELRDAAGNLARDELHLVTNLGKAEVTALSRGQAVARVRVPDAFEGKTALEIQARCASGPASAKLSVPLLAAAPARAEIDFGPAKVRADGAARLRLRMRVEDRFGNPVPDAQLAAAAEPGTVTAPASEGAGAYAALYTPPLSREGGGALVHVRVGAAEGLARIPLLGSPARAALTPKLGALTNFGRLRSPLAALELGLRFEAFGLPFAAVLEASYFFTAHANDPVAPGLALAASTHASYFALAPGLSVRPEIGDRTQAFFTAAPSLALLRSSQQLDGQPGLALSAATPGVLLAAGVEHRFGRFVPTVEARWSWHRDPRLASLQGPVRGFALLFGSRLELF